MNDWISDPFLVLSFQSFSFTISIPLLDPLPLIIPLPETLNICSTSGCFSTIFSTFAITSFVRFSLEPIGNEISIKTPPISSLGTKDFGVVFISQAKIPAKTTNPAKAIHFFLRRNKTPLEYRFTKASKMILKLVKNRCIKFCFFSSWE